MIHAQRVVGEGAGYTYRAEELEGGRWMAVFRCGFGGSWDETFAECESFDCVRAFLTDCAEAYILSLTVRMKAATTLLGSVVELKIGGDA